MNDKIWIFNHYIVPPSIEAGSRHNKFAKYLSKDGFDVSLFFSSAIHNSDKNLIENTQKYSIEQTDQGRYVAIKTRNYRGNGKQRILNMVEYFFGLFKTTPKYKKRFGKPSIIYASSVHPLTCVAGILISKRYKVKCIIEIRDLWPLTLVELGKIGENSFIAKLMYWLECWIYKKADSIIFTGEGEKRYIIDRGWDKKINMSKIYYINNGIDLDVFNNQKINDIYNDIDIDRKDTFKLIYTGSIREANNVMRIVNVAEYLNNTELNNKIVFLVFGDGTDKEKLEHYCLEKGLTNIIFKGSVKKKYIPNILSKSNVNILNYSSKLELFRYGGSQNKLFEYFASGKPIISTIKMNPDIISNYNCGVTVEGDSTIDTVEKIVWFYNLDQGKYKGFCENAIKAANNYDFKHLTINLEKVITNTLEDNHEHTFD